MTSVSTNELDEYAATIRGYCRDRLPAQTLARPSVVRDAEAAKTHWRQMCTELGIGALLISAEHGGEGATLIEAGRVAEALGAELATVPFLSSGVLAPVLLSALAGSSDEAASLLGRLAEGAIVAVAWADDDTGAPSEGPLHGFDSGKVSASLRYVVDADLADVVVLIGAGGREIVAVEADALTITARPTFDLTRGLADVQADAASAVTLANGDEARAAFDAMLDAGRLILAAESAGGALAARDLSVDYAKTRVQFGREIGSFQAIKHMLADSFVNSESAVSVARLAIASYVGQEPDSDELLATAAFYPADRYSEVAATGIQVHGGIGFTVECAAHLYRRRAESNRHLLGDPARLKAALVSVLSVEEASA